MRDLLHLSETPDISSLYARKFRGDLEREPLFDAL